MIVHGFTDNDPFPPLFGASQRLFGLYRGLARAHRVRVLAVVPNRSSAAATERAGGFDIVRRKAAYTAATWRLERLGLAPHFLAASLHRARAAGWRAALGGDPDVVVADLSMAGVLEGGTPRLRVYHAHNVEFDHFLAAGPRLVARHWWSGRLRDLEARAVRAADVVVAASDEDGGRFRDLYGVAPDRVVVVRNGYDETALRPPGAGDRAAARAAFGLGPGDYAGLFLGSDVPHNRAALALLVDQVMPGLAATGIRLLVVGAVSSALAGRREPWLIARPATADPLAALHAADVGLNPVLGGGGSNVKLPTYLACGLAVLSTPHGARGFRSLEPWVTRAEPGGFGEALAARPQGWAARGESAPAPLAEYAWGTLGGRLGDELSRRLATKAGDGPSPVEAVERRAGAGSRS